MIKLAFVALSAVAAKCPFGFGKSNSEDGASESARNLQTINYPSDYFTCPGTAVETTTDLTPR